MVYVPPLYSIQALIRHGSFFPYIPIIYWFADNVNTRTHGKSTYFWNIISWYSHGAGNCLCASLHHPRQRLLNQATAVSRAFRYSFLPPPFHPAWSCFSLTHAVTAWYALCAAFPLPQMVFPSMLAGFPGACTLSAPTDIVKPLEPRHVFAVFFPCRFPGGLTIFLKALCENHGDQIRANESESAHQ